MASRDGLYEIFSKILGNENVYFNPPESINMSYPAIKYSISGEKNIYAGNKKYNKRIRYTVMIIDYDPDSPITDKIDELPFTSFDRAYKADGLNHFVYTLYY